MNRNRRGAQNYERDLEEEPCGCSFPSRRLLACAAVAAAAAGNQPEANFATQ